MGCAQIIIHVYQFLRCKINVVLNPSSSQHYDRSHYSIRRNSESKHFTREYTFKQLLLAAFAGHDFNYIAKLFNPLPLNYSI